MDKRYGVYGHINKLSVIVNTSLTEKGARSKANKDNCTKVVYCLGNAVTIVAEKRGGTWIDVYKPMTY